MSYIVSNAQEFHIGIRGGVNLSTVKGPSESGVIEKYSYANGFHFGVEGLYSLNDYFSIGTEILYSQLGANYTYEGPSYYIFFTDGNYLLKSDNVKYNLNISNSYINIPVNIFFRPIKSLELKLGGYMGFLINPTATGKLSFGNKFNQQLKYNYYSDKKPSYYDYAGRLLHIKTYDEEDNEIIRTTRKTANAYYQFRPEDYENDAFYNVLDYGLNMGANYYINSGLYLGLSLQYGLADITNDKLDRSLKTLEDDGDLYFNNDDHYIFRKDKDTNYNLQLSIGFRF